MTTTPNVATDAISHTGGWSEGFWATEAPGAFQDKWHAILTARAKFLPKQAQIVGFRTQTYEIAGNKLMPLGASAGAYRYPGSVRFDCDQPQVTLRARATAQGAQNTASLYMRGIPDSWVFGGEYDPVDDANTLLSAYYRQLITKGAGFIGRNLNIGSVRVLNVIDLGGNSGSAITCNAAVPGVALNDFVRLIRVRDVNGKSIEGVYNVTNVNGAVITVRALSGRTVLAPSGLCRKDSLAFNTFGVIATQRITTKRVGSPFEKYRGRRSKRRV